MKEIRLVSLSYWQEVIVSRGTSGSDEIVKISPKPSQSIEDWGP
jgi:hypothetical protein